MPEEREESPVLDHLGAEFLVWLWYVSEAFEGRIDLGEPLGVVEFWVDDRMAFRSVDDGRPRTILTGDQPARSLEARASLAGGKVLASLRVGLRREDRESTVTLDGPLLDYRSLKVSGAVRDGATEEVLADRAFLVEEVTDILRALFRRFAIERTGPCWVEERLPAMRAWAAGEEAGLDPAGGVDRSPVTP